LNYFCHQIAWEFEQFTHHQLLPRKRVYTTLGNFLIRRSPISFKPVKQGKEVRAIYLQ
jgi:hypothetical protein